jgi:predicted DCC family thiol-disulfide oxidoreductase YuxK
LKIVEALGFPYNLGMIGYILPKKWRDAGYQWLAKRRYRYGKRYDSCPMPPEKWRDRFLSEE